MHWKEHDEDISSTAGEMAIERERLPPRRSSGGSRAESRWPTNARIEQ
jgi:hypothetical protein